MSPMDLIKDSIQWVNLGLHIGVLIVSAVAFVKYPRTRIYFLPLGILALHSTAFYVAILFDIAPFSIRTLWSATLRLHGAVVLLGLSYLFWVGARTADRGTT